MLPGISHVQLLCNCTGSMPVPDLGSYPSLGHAAFSAQPAANDLPMHKLSTGSLPATLPSAHMPSLVQESLSTRGSPATSRKRQRNLQNDEKVGARREVKIVVRY